MPSVSPRPLGSFPVPAVTAAQLLEAPGKGGVSMNTEESFRYPLAGPTQRPPRRANSCCPGDWLSVTWGHLGQRAWTGAAVEVDGKFPGFALSLVGGSEEFLPLWTLVGPEIVRIYEPDK